MVLNNEIESSKSRVLLKDEKPSFIENDHPNSQIPNFSDIKISTETIIAVTNLVFDLNNLYNYLPIVDYQVVKRKRGRKKKTETIDPNKNIAVGSIISVQSKTNIRGAILKKKKDSKTYFLNSIIVIMILSDSKLINMKISEDGKIQITGCKTNNHFIECGQYIYKNIKEAEELIGEKICRYKWEETSPRMIFNIVMKNIDFKAGFSIQRDDLDTFMNMNTEFTSHYEASITTGVNIKIKSTRPYEDNLIQMDLDEDCRPHLRDVPYKNYLDFLDEKGKKKEERKQKFFTFLVFCSGSIIMSGSGPDMEEVYKKFMKILIKNRSKFEEKLNQDEDTQDKTLNANLL
jgi:TATA-box binding protein (TBP) (component of TFIID and TFIIIB)